MGVRGICLLVVACLLVVHSKQIAEPMWIALPLRASDSITFLVHCLVILAVCAIGFAVFLLGHGVTWSDCCKDWNAWKARNDGKDNL